MEGVTRAQKIKRDYSALRVLSLAQLVREDEVAGSHLAEDAKAELEELLACVERCEAEVADLESELADRDEQEAQHSPSKRVKAE